MKWTHSFNCIRDISLILVLFIGLTGEVLGQDISTLRQVNIIVRHGARSPTNPFPKDPYKDYWPQGYGQLTKVGVQQMFDLGGYIKQQYIGFLNTTYINDELLVRSSNFDRTLMSAQSLLAGLYPTTSSGQRFDPALAWQPVPVHTVSPEEDILLDMDDTVCPPYDQMKIDITESESFQKENATHKAYYERLRNFTGIDKDFNPFTVWDVYDTVHAEDTEGLGVPAWYTPRDEELMAGFFIPWQMDIHYGGLDKGRLKGGPLITEMVENMHLAMNGSMTPARRKAFLYMGHDNNIVTTMKITQTYPEHYVPYASYLVLELHEIDSQFYVQMLYRNSTSLPQPHVIPITVCGNKTLCPVGEFIAAVKPYFITTEEWFQECQGPKPLPAVTLAGIVCVTVGVAGILVLLLGAVLYLCKAGVEPRPTAFLPANFEKDERTPIMSR